VVSQLIPQERTFKYLWNPVQCLDQDKSAPNRYTVFIMSLRSMFTSVASRYDLLNRILTFGLDDVWRKTCAGECISKGVVIDLCCGTGKLAQNIQKRLPPQACLLGLDFNKAMLNKAVQETRSRVTFIVADAAYLPFVDASVDRVAISFSFRNLVFRNPKAMTHVKEIARTLREKGRFACIETSQPDSRMIQILFHLYCKKVVPLVGWLVSKRKAPYRYLGASAADFLSAREINALLLKAGFHKVSFKDKTLGTIALHVAVKEARARTKR